MFTDSDDMKSCTAKSVLNKLLQSEAPVTNKAKQNMHSYWCLVVLFIIRWSANGKLKDYTDNMKDYLREMLGRDVYLLSSY